MEGQRVDDLSEDQIQKFLHGTLLFSRDTDDSLSLIVLRDGVEKRVELFSYTLFKRIKNDYDNKATEEEWKNCSHKSRENKIASRTSFNLSGDRTEMREPTLFFDTV